MAKALSASTAFRPRDAKRGSLRWLLTLGLLTLLSAAIGGGFGLVMVSGSEAGRGEVQGSAEKPEIVSAYTGEHRHQETRSVVHQSDGLGEAIGSG